MQKNTFKDSRLYRIISLIISCFTLFFFNINIIQAQCDCDLKPLEDITKTTKDIFVGQVIKKAVNPNNTSEKYRRSKYRGVITTFQIQIVYKGTLEFLEEVEVLSGNGIEDNSINFVLGEYYVVFLEDFIDSCSYTKPYSHEYSYKINGLIRGSINGAPPPPPAPIIPSKYETSLFRYETKPNFFDIGLKGVFQLKNQPSKIIDDEVVVEDLKQFIHQKLNLENGKLYLHLKVNINQSFTFLSFTRSSHEIIKKRKLLIDYLSNKYIVQTEGYDCLLSNTYVGFYFQY